MLLLTLILLKMLLSIYTANFRAASGVMIDIDHEKINQISTTQHYIDQNIDHKSSLKGVYLQHYTFCDQKVHAHFGRTVS